MFCDIKNLTVDDLAGQLRVAEDQFEDKIEHITDKAGSDEPMALQVSPSIIFFKEVQGVKYFNSN